MTKPAKPRTCVLTVKCVSCKAKRDIKAGTPEALEMPFCKQCGSVMVMHSAKTVLSSLR